jgi:hypothetical protein
MPPRGWGGVDAVEGRHHGKEDKEDKDVMTTKP